MVFFRADGNKEIGTGHVMRCLSLADAFREQGVPSVFVTAEPDMRPLIWERGYGCLTLGGRYDRMEEELPALLPLLEENRPVCVILDSYFVTPDYMSAVRNEAPLVYIDDLGLFDYPADVVVNYNLYGKDIAYPAGKKYLLGPRYAPLRKQFQGLPPRVVREQAEQILFSTGGTDQHHVALGCVERLRERPPGGNVRYHFILGGMNQDAGQIAAIAEGLPYIMLHRQVSDMRSLMLQCDAAVSAAGTTLYELCACGLPTVTYILADNQVKGAEAFAGKNVMLCAGDIRKDANVVESIFSKLDSLKDGKIRQTAARKMQSLVDGNGAKRLAEELPRLLR